MPFDATGFKQDVALLNVLLEGRRRVAASWFRCGPGDCIPPDGHCAVFAISRQRNVDALIVPALAMLTRIACGSGDCVDLRRWNDAPGRTKEDVLAAYDIAIAG